MIVEKGVDKELETFFMSHQYYFYRPGEIILNATNVSDIAFYIKSGIVHHHIVTNSGDYLTINWAKPHTIFPIYPLLAHTHNHYYYEALTKVEVYRAPKKAFIEFLYNSEVSMSLTLRIILEECYVTNQRIEVFMKNSIENRLKYLLLQIALNFGKKIKNKTIIPIPLSHTTLSAWAGSTRETVSKSLKQIKQDGIIKMQGHYIIINDLKLLQEKF